jgi:hypothetical protein
MPTKQQRTECYSHEAPPAVCSTYLKLACYNAVRYSQSLINQAILFRDTRLNEAGYYIILGNKIFYYITI